MTAAVLVLASAVAGWLGTWGVRTYARVHLVDHPNERSSHRSATPRGGGLAIAVVVALVATIAGLREERLAPLSFIVSPPLVALAALGWWDDHGHVAAPLRFLLHVAAGVWVCWWLALPEAVALGPWEIMVPALVSTPVAVVFVAWQINATNFMDGIDGIAAGHSIAASLGHLALFCAAAGEIPPLLDHPLPVLASVTAGSCLGFLVWNWAPAKIFLGDVGSTVLGLVVAAQVLLLVEFGVPVTFALLPSAPFLIDATLTLGKRLCRKERLHHPHRSHLYQRLVQRYGRHGPVAVAYVAASVVLGTGGVILRSAPWGAIALLAGATVLHVCAALIFRKPR